MSNYQDLLLRTAHERGAFLSIPIIHDALEKGVDRRLYLAYLAEAYHHVKHTCPLLALAASRCGPADDRLQAALFNYIAEERGHDAWILEDIAALGGDVAAVRRSAGGDAARIMVGYAYYAVQWISPYCLLGMVHVLEGVSAAIASQAAGAIRMRLGEVGGGGFSYLENHGALDQAHVKFFEALVNDVHDPEVLATVIDTARVMYRLFGGVFKDLEARYRDGRDAA